MNQGKMLSYKKNKPESLLLLNQDLHLCLFPGRSIVNWAAYSSLLPKSVQFLNQDLEAHGLVFDLVHNYFWGLGQSVYLQDDDLASLFGRHGITMDWIFTWLHCGQDL